ncbi:unnamed protein product [Ilex paraguariensis]|uniref:Glycine zipper 2TM domain-containing protein n=1 Tax=Ilex paraguariensis TaxID=185542 RepID=A0ABC8S7H1_9AQUA
MRAQLLFMTAGIIVLSLAAEKCRQLVGKESASKSWTERFALVECFDMGYGTVACLIKQFVKLYFYYMRAVNVHKIRVQATDVALKKELSQGHSYADAMKRARQQGKDTAKQASKQAKFIMGPVISSGWDLFETLYVGGTLAEAITRSIGTFFGAYIGGIIGDGKLRWMGHIVGSLFGSWVGGRVGLMAYDIGKGGEYLLHVAHKE